MALQPHQQRVVDEKRELDQRRTRLTEFILGDAFNSLPAQVRSLLSDQLLAMHEYGRLLDARIALFHPGGDMSTDTGGPAFPSMRDMRHNPDFDHEEGMTLRDYFAAHASDADIEAMRERTKREHGLFEPDNWRQVARFMHADLMLKARSA